VGPLAAAILSIAINLAGEGVARTGFEMLQPVSVIQEEILKDPTSAIAVTNIIAQKNGERPGSASPIVMLASLLPVLLMVGIDARRRPVPAALGLGLGVFAVFGWLMLGAPAYRPMAPDPMTAAIALALTALAALVGGVAGKALAATIEPEGKTSRATA
jgi:hypothetical protein